MNLDVLSRASGGVVLALLAAVGIAGFLGGAGVENQTDVVDEVIARSPLGFECPKDWTMTDGLDPESGDSIVSCQSPDKRYIITSKGNSAPQAFDTETGTFVDVSRLK